MKKLNLVLVLVLAVSFLGYPQVDAQWRGPDRNGVFPARNLLKTWPEGGPKLLWVREGLDRGYSSVSVTNEAIYLTGRKGREEYLTVFDHQGKQLWRIPYGQRVRGTFPDTRCTPTIEKNRVYLISGIGEVVCIDSKHRKILWSVPAFEKFKGETWKWDIAENPLIVDNKVICTPGGNHTAMAALDKMTGETIWQTVSLIQPPAYVSPILIKMGKNKIIVNVMTEDIFGVDAANGKIVWKVKYVDIQPPTFHKDAPNINCITPLYHDGCLFITSGYNHVGIMFKITRQGEKIDQLWINPTLDCHHGQVVKLGDYLYGANWIDNRNGNWCCLNWKTGKTMYEKKWHCKGSISAADGMLYCYEEKQGNIALVQPTPEDFKVISTFKITHGSGPHWTQPVIHNGVMYIRHGDALMAYQIQK
jgi:outer membrane protein assembly factor BamB